MGTVKFFVPTGIFKGGLRMSESEVGKVTVGRRPIADYIVSIALLFNQGMKKVLIRGRGENISKAVNLYNAVIDRMGDSVRLVNVSIGSENREGKVISYIEILIERTV